MFMFDAIRSFWLSSHRSNRMALKLESNLRKVRNNIRMNPTEKGCDLNANDWMALPECRHVHVVSAKLLIERSTQSIETLTDFPQYDFGFTLQHFHEFLQIVCPIVCGHFPQSVDLNWNVLVTIKCISAEIKGKMLVFIGRSQLLYTETEPRKMELSFTPHLRCTVDPHQWRTVWMPC